MSGSAGGVYYRGGSDHAGTQQGDSGGGIGAKRFFHGGVLHIDSVLWRISQVGLYLRIA